MNRGQRVARRVLALLGAFGTAVLASAENEPSPIDVTGELVVMIEADIDGGTAVGAGIVFGFEADRLFVVTANHVVRRAERTASAVKVQLKRQPNRWFAAEVTEHFDPARDGLDLAVLVVPTGSERRIDPCALPIGRLGVPSQLQRGTPVFPIGYPSGAPWSAPVTADHVASITGNRISFESTSIRAGFSGGPLVTDMGWIVGIVQQDQAPYGVALMIDTAIAKLEAWGYPIQAHVSYTNGSKPLHLAASKGDDAKVQAILSRAVCGEVNDRNNYNAVPLHFAVGGGHQTTLEMLLDAGAETVAPDLDGDTPLHWAAEKGGVLAIDALVAGGADVEAMNNAGWTPLYWAVKGGHGDALQALIKAGADVNVQRDQHSSTPLHLAIENRQGAIVDVLLAADADVNAVRLNANDEPLTALGEVARRYAKSGALERDTARSLLAAGAKVHASELCSGPGMSAVVHHAGVVELVHQSIIGINEPVTTCDAPDDRLLHAAAFRTPTEALALLVDAGADVNAPGFSGWTPATRALREGNTANAEFLVSRGGTFRSDGSVELLWKAVEQGAARSVDALVVGGVNVNGGSFRARVGTPLHKAIDGGHLAIVASLIDAGADLTNESMNLTPLARAASLGHVEMVAKLLEAGADPRDSNNFSEAPIHFAAREGHVEVVGLLISAGSDLEQTTNQNKTPLALATDPETIALLQAQAR